MEAKPSLAGVLYDLTADTDWPPTTPVVSILQLTFHPEVNTNDQEQSVATLWRGSVKYVSTIPSFRTLHCAPV